MILHFIETRWRREIYVNRDNASLLAKEVVWLEWVSLYNTATGISLVFSGANSNLLLSRFSTKLSRWWEKWCPRAIYIFPLPSSQLLGIVNTIPNISTDPGIQDFHNQKGAINRFWVKKLEFVVTNYYIIISQRHN